MIPTTLARQLRRGLEDHLQAMFPVATPAFRDALPALLGDEPAWFRGPYLTMALPFREGNRPASDFFRHVTFGRQPYMHQQQAFARLLDHEPRSTIVATGTGSGKTECFMLPILEHVVRLRDEGVQGVKAVLVYPMNALATDQARRLARQIHDDDGLRGRVTAGLYVGDAPESASMAMTEADIITDRETLRQHPPDILLTNYKMLDLLLLRPRDARLWRHNLPGTLRFLVVDELHTFDGAQGTDLACLVRRMEARLGHPERPLCVIGTSATLGQDAGAGALAAHAGRLFGQEVPPEAILGETRLDLETVLDLDGPRPDTPGDPPVPDPRAVMRLVDDPALAPLELARRLVPLYFPDWTPADDGPDASQDAGSHLARELSRRLRPHPWLAALLRVLGGRTLPMDDVLAGLGSRLGAFAPDAPGTAPGGLSRADREALLLGFVALVAVARVPQA
ncbi:MAG: DEAD/DEAH box helicase, partial [Candidatus Sericytochromatia bacterium]|nr:DEAD/DEAH box helicase [Candidatus Sericytochromatia bacterium]